MNILHVLPHSPSNNIVSELNQLLTAKTNGEDVNCLICLGGEDGATRSWRSAGVSVQVLDWRRRLDPRPLLLLVRQIRAMQPDVIHAWGPSAFRAICLAAPRTRSAVVVRHPLHRERPRAPLPGIDRLLLKRADRILACSYVEAHQCTAAGLPPDRVRIVPRGLSQLSTHRAGSRPLILCAGAFLPHNGLLGALWAFDMIDFVRDDIELAIIGDGPQRPQMEKFAAGAGLTDRTHMPGRTDDLTPWLARASIVWVPTCTANGADLALQAMAAGLPVIAANGPELAECVKHEETGLLIEPDNKMELARQTMRLLNDVGLRRRLGEAGAHRAAEHFSPQSFVEAWTDACRQAAA